MYLNCVQTEAPIPLHSTPLQTPRLGWVLVSVLALVFGLQRLGNLFALWLMRQSNADTEAINIYTIYRYRYRYRYR